MRWQTDEEGRCRNTHRDADEGQGSWQLPGSIESHGRCIGSQERAVRWHWQEELQKEMGRGQVNSLGCDGVRNGLEPDSYKEAHSTPDR